MRNSAFEQIKPPAVTLRRPTGKKHAVVDNAKRFRNLQIGVVASVLLGGIVVLLAI